jgi:hypothetical protein
VLKNGATLNLFAEPQYTVARDGIAPQRQVFMGLNLVDIAKDGYVDVERKFAAALARD